MNRSLPSFKNLFCLVVRSLLLVVCSPSYSFLGFRMHVCAFTKYCIQHGNIEKPTVDSFHLTHIEKGGFVTDGLPIFVIELFFY